MAAFADEINDRPMLLALLQMRELQVSQLATSESATLQYNENDTNVLCHLASCEEWGEVDRLMIWVNQLHAYIDCVLIVPSEI